MAQTQKQSHKIRVNVLFDGTTTTAGSVQVYCVLSEQPLLPKPNNIKLVIDNVVS